MLRAVVVVLVGLLLSGCFSIGNNRISDEKLIVQLEQGKGKITREDVRKLLGRPMSVMSPAAFGLDLYGLPGGQSETWMYMYMYSAVRPATFIPYIGLLAGGADSTSHTLTLQFDSAGLLQWVGKGEMSGGGGGLQDVARAPIQATPEPPVANAAAINTASPTASKLGAMQTR